MRTARRGSKWRAKVFRKLYIQQGDECAQCGLRHRWVWRQAGTWSNEDWGTDEDGIRVSRYTLVNQSSNLEVDHITPLWAGGDNDLENLWLLCRACHKKKTSVEQSQRLRTMLAEARA